MVIGKFSHYEGDVPVFDEPVEPVEPVAAPTTFVSHVGMVVAIDRVEGALNYVNLALSELEFCGGDKMLAHEYLVNARFLLIGQKVT